MSYSQDDGWWDTAKKEQRWWYSILKTIISSGPVPQHIAFVMDGNRRYAKNNKLGSVLNGHVKGFQQLAKILEWCQDLRIKEVTVYAFSIENFKRSSEEVNGLMQLAEDKFARLLSERDKLKEKQICFRFFGNIGLLSERLKFLIKEIQSSTKDYTNGIVNVCMPYTSRDELTRAFEIVRCGIHEGIISEDDISVNLITKSLDSRKGSHPDLLVRTSGEKRLSDFLLWQCSNTHIYFDDVLWPEFHFLNLCKAVISYQFHNSAIQKLNKGVHPLEIEFSQFVDCRSDFLVKS